MVKKISIYTACGQFFAMIDTQTSSPSTSSPIAIATDRFVPEAPLSDYQEELKSISSDLQVKSCPVAAESHRVVRRTLSCPLAAFDADAPAEFGAVSPIPTTVETRKLNEATELMMSFWKVHVTTRKPRSQPADELPMPISLFEKLDEFFKSSPVASELPSIFEKFNGVFATTPVSNSSVPSLFEKLEGVFAPSSEDLVWNPLPENKPVDGVFDDEKTASEDPTMPSALSTIPSTTYYCTACKSWNSIDTPDFPQLPVFVKSPIDSLKIYEANKFCQNTGEMADDELTVTVRSMPKAGPSVSADSSESNDSTIIVRRDGYWKQKFELQQEIIERQKAIIESLLKLNKISAKLTNAASA
uniref:Uncharacterized protein n=1 Tax=Caenorhabditis japonica TaxID=281687 RepID=A0A8R1DHP3_CAEJA